LVYNIICNLIGLSRFSLEIVYEELIEVLSEVPLKY